jgi:hypothetical protein
MNTRFHWLNVLLDTVALIIAVCVDLILNVICMLILAPGPLEAVGFVAISFVVVLFAIRSWLKGNKLLWAMFALVCFFFDLSFTLISTDVQTKSQSVTITAETDSEYQYLQAKAKDAQAALIDLRSQYRAAYRRETMDELDAMIQDAQRVAMATDQARTTRRQMIESGELNAQATRQRATITAEMIFGAIPSAVVKARYIPLAVFALIFAGLQLVMVTAASSGINKTGKRQYIKRIEKKAPDPLTPEERLAWKPWVDTWVFISWYGKRAGRSTKIVDRETFGQFIKNKGTTFSDRRYRIILEAAQAGGVVAQDGEILIADEGEAWEKISDNLLTKLVKRDKLEIEETVKQPELF